MFLLDLKNWLVVVLKCMFRGQNYIMAGTSPFISIVAILWTLSNTLISFLNCGVQKCTQDSRWGHTNAEYSRIILFGLAGHAVFGAPRMWFALLAARALLAHVELLSTSTTRPLSAGQLSRHSSLNLCLCLVILCPRCRLQQLFPSSTSQVAL